MTTGLTVRARKSARTLSDPAVCCGAVCETPRRSCSCDIRERAADRQGSSRPAGCSSIAAVRPGWSCAAGGRCREDAEFPDPDLAPAMSFAFLRVERRLIAARAPRRHRILYFGADVPLTDRCQLLRCGLQVAGRRSV